MAIGGGGAPVSGRRPRTGCRFGGGALSCGESAGRRDPSAAGPAATSGAARADAIRAPRVSRSADVLISSRTGGGAQKGLKRPPELQFNTVPPRGGNGGRIEIWFKSYAERDGIDSNGLTNEMNPVLLTSTLIGPGPCYRPMVHGQPPRHESFLPGSALHPRPDFSAASAFVAPWLNSASGQILPLRKFFRSRRRPFHFPYTFLPPPCPTTTGKSRTPKIFLFEKGAVTGPDQRRPWRLWPGRPSRTSPKTYPEPKTHPTN